MTATANLPKRKFDVVIVGAGGSGMRASLQLARRRPGAVLDQHRMAGIDERAYALGRERHAVFVILGFLRYADFHARSRVNAP